MTDEQYERAIAHANNLLATRPNLRPVLERLYAEAWPETLSLLTDLSLQLIAPAPQDGQPGSEVAYSASSAPNTPPPSPAQSRGPGDSSSLGLQRPISDRQRPTEVASLAPGGGAGAEPLLLPLSLFQEVTR